MVRLAARWPAFVMFGVFVVAWGVARAAFEIDVRFSDVPLFQRYGEAMAAGEYPYRDVKLEYPPGALPLFWLPAVFSNGLAGYALALELLLLLSGAVALLAMDVVLCRLKVSGRQRWAALLLFALSPLLLGRVVAERFDLWPAALTVAALAAAVTGRNRTAAAALGLGTAAKLFPAVLLPLLVCWAWQQAGRRVAAQTLAWFGTVVIAVFLPFLITSPTGLADVFERQLERPLQLETFGSSLLQLAHHTVGLSLGTEASYGSMNLGGSSAAAAEIAQSLLIVGLLIAIWAGFGRSRVRTETFVLAIAATLTAVVAFGKVLSPQFLVWILPLVPLVKGRSGAIASALLAATCIVTNLLFPGHYVSLIRLEGGASSLLLARNLLLVALLVVLLAALFTQIRRQTRVLPTGSSLPPVAR